MHVVYAVLPNNFRPKSDTRHRRDGHMVRIFLFGNFFLQRIQNIAQNTMKKSLRCHGNRYGTPEVSTCKSVVMNFVMNA